jgi:hypothetical protein
MDGTMTMVGQIHGATKEIATVFLTTKLKAAHMDTGEGEITGQAEGTAGIEIEAVPSAQRP